MTGFITHFFHKQSSAEPFFLDCRGLAPQSFYDSLLIYDWTQGGLIENTFAAYQWIYTNI
jgi:hypothetical protein